MAAQKKSQIASEREEEVRGLWRWLASRFDARRLVFVDESGFHTSMTRLRARAPKGKRAYGKVPKNRGKNQTLIAAISLEGAMGESMSLEGGTDALAFGGATLFAATRSEAIEKMKQAILAIEDLRFYEHIGIDPVRLVGAVLENVRRNRYAQETVSL